MMITIYSHFKDISFLKNFFFPMNWQRYARFIIDSSYRFIMTIDDMSVAGGILTRDPWHRDTALGAPTSLSHRSSW